MSYASEVLADSPLVYWRFGEASGTVATDASGNSRDGTYSASAVLGATALINDSDTAVSVTTGSIASIAFATWMNVTNALTLEIWAKTTSGGIQPLWDRDNGGSARAWQFRLNNGAFEFIKVGGGGGTATVASPPAIYNDGNAHHFVATYDGSNIRLYVDGSLVKTQALAGTLATPSQQLRIGATTSGTAVFTGTTDEPAMYATVLTPTRIAAHYAAGTAMPPTSGSFAATLPKPTVALSGAYRDAGSFAVTLPKPTVALTGTYQAPPTGTFAATLPKVTAALSGDYTPPATPTGDLHATLPKPTAALTGEYHQHETGTFDAVLPFPTVALTGTYIARETGTFAATLPVPDVAFTGDYAEPPHPTGLLHPTLLLPVVAFAGTYTGPTSTDTTNGFRGRTRYGYGTVTMTRPTAPVPPGRTFGQRVDKAIAYPVPDMVDGRPT